MVFSHALSHVTCLMKEHAFAFSATGIPFTLVALRRNLMVMFDGTRTFYQDKEAHFQQITLKFRDDEESVPFLLVHKWLG